MNQSIQPPEPPSGPPRHRSRSEDAQIRINRILARRKERTSVRRYSSNKFDTKTGLDVVCAGAYIGFELWAHYDRVLHKHRTSIVPFDRRRVMASYYALHKASKSSRSLPGASANFDRCFWLDSTAFKEEEDKPVRFVSFAVERYAMERETKANMERNICMKILACEDVGDDDVEHNYRESLWKVCISSDENANGGERYLNIDLARRAYRRLNRRAAVSLSRERAEPICRVYDLLQYLLHLPSLPITMKDAAKLHNGRHSWKHLCMPWSEYEFQNAVLDPVREIVCSDSSSSCSTEQKKGGRKRKRASSSSDRNDDYDNERRELARCRALVASTSSDSGKICECRGAKRDELADNFVRLLERLERTARKDRFLLYRNMNTQWANTDMLRSVWREIPPGSFARVVAPVIAKSPHLYECCDALCNRDPLEHEAADYAKPLHTVLHPKVHLFGCAGDIQKFWWCVAANWSTQALVRGIVEVLARGIREFDETDIEALRATFVTLMRRGAIALAVPFSFFADRKIVRREFDDCANRTGLYEFASAEVRAKCVASDGRRYHQQRCRVVGNLTALIVMNHARDLGVWPRNARHFGAHELREGHMRTLEYDAARANISRDPKKRLSLKLQAIRTNFTEHGYVSTNGLLIHDYEECEEHLLRVFCTLLEDHLYTDAKRISDEIFQWFVGQQCVCSYVKRAFVNRQGENDRRRYTMQDFFNRSNAISEIG